MKWIDNIKIVIDREITCIKIDYRKINNDKK